MLVHLGILKAANFSAVDFTVFGMVGFNLCNKSFSFCAGDGP